MKAATIVAHRKPLEVGEVADPKIGPQDAIVRVEAEGMCRSDWHTWNGDWGWVGFLPPLPIIPGHEFGGTVVEVGSEVERVKAGDRVTVPFTEACGRCEACWQGRSTLCHNINAPGYTHNGGYAELAAVLNADFNCIKLPDSIDTLTASALSCRYTTAFNAVNRMGRIQAGQWVTVFGTGGMGLCAVQIAAQSGGQVIAIDIKDDALALATKNGAVATINSTKVDDVPGAVKEISGGGAHLSIDCHSRGAVPVTSLLGLRRGGRHVNAGLTSQEEQGMVALPTDLINVLELEYVGCSATPHIKYPELFAFVANGRLKPQDLVTRKINISEASDAMSALDRNETLGMVAITSF